MFTAMQEDVFHRDSTSLCIFGLIFASGGTGPFVSAVISAALRHRNSMTAFSRPVAFASRRWRKVDAEYAYLRPKASRKIRVGPEVVDSG